MMDNSSFSSQIPTHKISNFETASSAISSPCPSSISSSNININQAYHLMDIHNKDLLLTLLLIILICTQIKS